MSYTLQNKTWVDFVQISDDIPDKRSMDLARDHLKKKVLLERPSDFVRASDQDFRSTQAGLQWCANASSGSDGESHDYGKCDQWRSKKATRDCHASAEFNISWDEDRTI